MIYGCRLKSRFKKSSQAGASFPAVTDTLTLRVQAAFPSPPPPLPSRKPAQPQLFGVRKERKGWARGRWVSYSPFPLELGVRAGRGRGGRAVSEGRRLNLGRSSRETIGLASCSQFSLLNSFSSCTWGLVSRNGAFQRNLLPSPTFAWGCKAKFPSWQISSFFTRLQTLGAGLG